MGADEVCILRQISKGLCFTQILSFPGTCDYREFRPYVNQHPYGALIADLIDHTGFVVGKHIGVQRLAVSASLSRREGVRVAKESRLDQ